MTDTPDNFKIGDECTFSCEWTRDGTKEGRVVSFDDDTICVAVRVELYEGSYCHEMFWVKRNKPAVGQELARQEVKPVPLPLDLVSG